MPFASSRLVAAGEGAAGQAAGDRARHRAADDAEPDDADPPHRASHRAADRSNRPSGTQARVLCSGPMAGRGIATRGRPVVHPIARAARAPLSRVRLPRPPRPGRHPVPAAVRRPARPRDRRAALRLPRLRARGPLRPVDRSPPRLASPLAAGLRPRLRPRAPGSDLPAVPLPLHPRGGPRRRGPRAAPLAGAARLAAAGVPGRLLGRRSRHPAGARALRGVDPRAGLPPGRDAAADLRLPPPLPAAARRRGLQALAPLPALDGAAGRLRLRRLARGLAGQAPDPARHPRGQHGGCAPAHAAAEPDGADGRGHHRAAARCSIRATR